MPHSVPGARRGGEGVPNIETGHSGDAPQREERVFDEGVLFVTFISLILRMRLLKWMKETGLMEDYTLDGMLLELSKIKKIKLANGETIVTELSKRQRTILEKLGLCA